MTPLRPGAAQVVHLGRLCRAMTPLRPEAGGRGGEGRGGGGRRCCRTRHAPVPCRHVHAPLCPSAPHPPVPAATGVHVNCHARPAAIILISPSRRTSTPHPAVRAGTWVHVYHHVMPGLPPSFSSLPHDTRLRPTPQSDWHLDPCAPSCQACSHHSHLALVTHAYAPH